MSPFNRRDLLRSAGVIAFAGAAASAGQARPAQAADSAVVPDFRHGVASGDPLPDSVLIWTRVTPMPDALPGSGLGPAVTVDWEVSEGSGFLRAGAHDRCGTHSRRAIRAGRADGRL
ncbi:PhoD-like phosphatase N-terminal domain-containing protein [Cryobacterium sp. TMT3-29-2]|uniref:PhoD-like phosphatase N-terminal domain-containing protein n=1 Tax=Cryobacterium sp. TMT3-29-2 TaxID=2555867 RepID=UPI0018E09380|nr:PhoD-like phosphatase N-terminal domain-containing protein [Cryobacterium sp. TMT3-29-2]